MKKEIIEIEFCPKNSKEWRQLEEKGLVGHISFHYKSEEDTYYTKIIFRDDQFRYEDLFHEFGHYFQFLLQHEGIPFSYNHELPFFLEDVMTAFIRTKLYNDEIPSDIENLLMTFLARRLQRVAK